MTLIFRTQLDRPVLHEHSTQLQDVKQEPSLGFAHNEGSYRRRIVGSAMNLFNYFHQLDRRFD